MRFFRETYAMLTWIILYCWLKVIYKYLFDYFLDNVHIAHLDLIAHLLKHYPQTANLATTKMNTERHIAKNALMDSHALIQNWLLLNVAQGIIQISITNNAM